MARSTALVTDSRMPPSRAPSRLFTLALTRTRLRSSAPAATTVTAATKASVRRQQDIAATSPTLTTYTAPIDAGASRNVVFRVVVRRNIVGPSRFGAEVG